MSGLEIISANMALDSGDADRRYQGFNEFIMSRDTPPDVIAFQEVAWCPGEAALAALCIQLGSEYSLETCSAYPNKGNEKGLAIISRHPIIQHEKIDLPAGGKGVQLATIEPSSGPRLQLANVHMEASPLKEIKRLRKIRQIIELLSKNPELAQLVIGDFNAEKFFPSVRRVKKLGMSSVFDTLKTKHPNTYPTSLTQQELIGQGYSKSHQYHAMRILGQFICGEISDDSGLRRSVVDYIFHNNLIRPTSAEVLPESHEGEVLSDHHFIAATVQLEQAQAAI